MVTHVTRPGQTTAFDTYLVNDTGHPLQVTGARVMGVPHQPVPRFVGVQAGWPPDAVQVSNIVGGQLPPGRSDLAAGITGSKIGHTYSAAGVVITFRDDGKAYRAVSWAQPSPAPPSPRIRSKHASGQSTDASTSCRTTSTLTERDAVWSTTWRSMAAHNVRKKVRRRDGRMNAAF